MTVNTVLVMKRPSISLASPTLVLNPHQSTALKRALYAK